jgi:hypothetical protein
MAKCEIDFGGVPTASSVFSRLGLDKVKKNVEMVFETCQ